MGAILASCVRSALYARMCVLIMIIITYDEALLAHKTHHDVIITD